MCIRDRHHGLGEEEAENRGRELVDYGRFLQVRLEREQRSSGRALQHSVVRGRDVRSGARPGSGQLENTRRLYGRAKINFNLIKTCTVIFVF